MCYPHHEDSYCQHAFGQAAVAHVLLHDKVLQNEDKVGDRIRDEESVPVGIYHQQLHKVFIINSGLPRGISIRDTD